MIKIFPLKFSGPFILKAPNIVETESNNAEVSCEGEQETVAEEVSRWKCTYCGSLNEAPIKKCTICFQDFCPGWLSHFRLGSRIIYRPNEFLSYYGIISEILVYKKQIGLTTLVQHYSVGDYKPGQAEFIKFTLYSTDIPVTLQNLPPTSALNAVIDDYGLCNQCFRTYYIHNSAQLHLLNGDDDENEPEENEALVDNDDRVEGDEDDEDKNSGKEEKPSTFELLTRLYEKLEKEKTLKDQMKQIQANDQVLQCTARIHEMQEQIHQIRKSNEPVQTSCPHCGWPEVIINYKTMNVPPTISPKKTKSRASD